MTKQTKKNTAPVVQKNNRTNYAGQIARKSISQTRQDIADLKHARYLASLSENPKQHLLQRIFKRIISDPHVFSQLRNIREQVVSADFALFGKDGKNNEAATVQLKAIDCLKDVLSAMVDSYFFGYSLVELSADGQGCQKAVVINRENVVPDNGRLYPDISFDQFIPYRDVAEYGRFLIEFYPGDEPIFNKIAPVAMYKNFAQSCYSEFCEIYGIPPRYLKTDTQNPEMLDRAEKMMRDFGAAAYYVIDTTEQFSFAEGISSNGDVYKNLIQHCHNDISMAIAGAIVGQDTVNGNRSKEEVSIGLTDLVVSAFKNHVTRWMNTIVLPAFFRIGWLSSTDCNFQFLAAEDKQALFDMTVKILPYMTVNPEFVREKFGIEVTGERFRQDSNNMNGNKDDNSDEQIEKGKEDKTKKPGKKGNF